MSDAAKINPLTSANLELAAQWVDAHFGNRNGTLEFSEKERFKKIVSAGTAGIVLGRARTWEGEGQRRARYAPLLGENSPEDFVLALTNDPLFNASVPSAPLIDSAWMITLSEGADLRSTTVYSYPELGYRSLYSGMILESIIQSAGADPTDYQSARFSTRYPLPVDRKCLLNILRLLDLKVRVESPADPTAPFGLVPLLAGGPRDFFAVSGSPTGHYELDFDGNRCLPGGEEKCATSEMTQSLIDAVLPEGMSLMDVIRGKDLVIFPFPIGNVMKEALFSSPHRVETASSLALLEKALEESEKVENPPLIVTATMGSSRPFTSPDPLGNRLTGRDDCRTFKVRGYAQTVDPRKAERSQKDDVCPLTELDIAQIDGKMEREYNLKLRDLEKRYPHLVVIDLGDFFGRIASENSYVDPETGEEIPFPVDKVVDIDGVHFTLEFQPHLARVMTLKMNEVLGTRFDADYLMNPSGPAWLADELTLLQFVYLQIAEEHRRKTYLQNNDTP